MGTIRRAATLGAITALSAATLAAVPGAGHAAPTLQHGCVAAGITVTCTYTETGVGTFTIPDNVTELTIEAVGGDGGHGVVTGWPGYKGAAGGRGAHLTQTVPVPFSAGGNQVLAPGQTLTFEVGGNGRNGTYGEPVPGGANGGGAGGQNAGSGGGATEIFGPAPDPVLFVAPGGGGGSGFCHEDRRCGAGGDSGQAGGQGENAVSATPGAPGSPTGPGSGGIGGWNLSDFEGEAGADGWWGRGGDGGWAISHPNTTQYHSGGGGGGAGWPGGGGGGGGGRDGNGAGGGGGTSFSIFGPDAPTRTHGDGTPRVVFTYIDHRVDPPTVHTSPLPATTMTSPVTLGWSGTDAIPGIASYDVRYRKATWKTNRGAWTTLLDATTTTTHTINVARGGQVCYQARSRDGHGVTSLWSTERCTTLPLDDRALKASRGWKRATGARFLNGTATTTNQKGRTLTLKGVPQGRAALVVTKARGSGALEVRYAGKVVKRFSLNGTTKHKALVNLPQLTKGTTITIRTTTKRPVRIDGIVVARK
ncbi:hypothetical protein [Nocardioides sp. J54]|uniref:hypothetical protein n=1 Tax=Nocardioides sp. J54 TaxID=935866 RepID=UPI00048B6366|nr:hypothetical protein [Nocardioides sp. J54]